ncbi:MAG: hypothetical protein CMM25_02375, partial [Rhodospirillaceae bacterium]|nr:hypothetical protein [Rhodospirillaceae bacterium]
MAEEKDKKGFSNYQLSAGTLQSLRAANKTYLTDFSPLEDLGERVSTEGVELAQAKENAQGEAKKQVADEKEKTNQAMKDLAKRSDEERDPPISLSQENIEGRLEQSLSSEEREMELAKKLESSDPELAKKKNELAKKLEQIAKESENLAK